MKNIARPLYTRHIASFLGKGLIIALTGQRRVGKSFILRQVADGVAAADARANVIYINKEQRTFAALRTAEDLDAYVASRLVADVENYLLIDEVQDIAGFERTLRSLCAEEACHIVITGSNALMLSSELSTYLAGRSVEVHIQSLSYAEFLTFHGLADSREALDSYLAFGGMPHLARLTLADEDVAWEYLLAIYNTIVLKDVVLRENLRNVTLFENIMRYAADNTGQLVSANAVSKYLKAQRVDLTPLTALNYLRAACGAYIINKVPRYDIHGKKLLESNDKYYFEDLGMRNALVGPDRAGDIEKVMENAVYLHLKARGYQVFVGTLGAAEIDFVARRAGRTLYVQVAFILATEQTAQREFGNLMAINDNYTKLVITMDDTTRAKDYSGITHMSLRQFLLAEI